MKGGLMATMETEARRPVARTNGAASSYEEASGSGAGWLVFAGVMVLILGLINVIGGIAAISGANFYTATGAHYQIASLNFWGWAILIVGVMQLIAAFSIWAGNAYGRWVGTISASLNIVAQLFLMAAFPLWSMTLIGLDVLVIYGLVVYGGKKLPA
jgi:hypothetical protein